MNPQKNHPRFTPDFLPFSKKRFFVAAALATLPFSLQAKPDLQKATLAPIQSPALPIHVAGGFAGKSHGFYLVAGALQKSDGALHLWSLSETMGAAWKETAQTVSRWAAMAQWGESVISAGGVLNGQLTNQVVMTQADSAGSVTSTMLPELPHPLAGAGATVIQDRLYLTGGITSLNAGTLTNQLWSLDLNNPTTGWKNEDPLPGAPRAFAAVTQQYDELCVFGGIQTELTSGKTTPSRESWIFYPKPPEASQHRGWSRMADLPQPRVGADAFPVGQSSVALVGGDATVAPGFLPTDSDSTQPSFLFQTVTDAWCEFDQPEPLTYVHAVVEGNALEGKTLLIGNRPGDSGLHLNEFNITRTARSLNGIDYLVIVCYFCFISMIGVVASRKQKSSADFSLGGRKVPWWVAGISMFATGASAISLMSIPALAFASNLVFLFPIVILIASYFVQAYAIFPLLRRMEITSTYEYLERRFNKTLRLIASAQCMLFQTFARASVVLVLPSLAISATTGIATWKSVIMMGCITTLYTAFGGFNAVVWTDVFQGILKFFAPLTMILICIFSLPGGPKEFVDVGFSHHKFDFALLTWDVTLPAVWILILGSFLATTIMQAGDQPVIQRVFSSPEKEVRRIAGMSVACSILISVVVNVLGIAIYTYFHAFPGRLDPLSQNDKIMPLFVVQALPHGMVGMVIAAIFASAMTTVASSMNSTATVFTEDFFMRFKPDASDKLRLRVLQTTSYLVGIIAICMALWLSKQNTKSFMQVWSVISALLGGGIVGVYSLGMFTRRANGFGAVGGAIASILMTAWVHFFTHWHWQILMPTAIIACMVFGYLLSFLSHHTKPLLGLTVFTPNKREP